MGNASTVANSSPDPVIPAPPQTAAVTQAATVPPVTDKYEQSGKAKWAGIVNGLVAGGVPRLNQIVGEAHQRRMADMDMYQKMSGTAAQVLTSGKDPNTGEPLRDAQGNLTEAGQKWQFQHDKAWGEYQKIAGITPEGKNILGRIGMISHHVIHGGTKQDEVSQQAAPATGGPIPAPPGKAAPAPAPTNVASALPPPPGGAVNPSSGATGAAPVTPAVQAAPMDLRTLAQGSPLTAARLAESEKLRAEQLGIPVEQAKQRAANQVALEQQKAVALQQAEIAGKEVEQAFPGISPELKQQYIARKLGFIPQMKITTKTIQDPESPTGWSDVSWDQVTGAVQTTKPGAPAPRTGTSFERVSYDQYGNRSVSTTTPVPITGSKQAPAKQAPSGTTPKAVTARAGLTQSPAIPPPLDDEGHIPAGPGVNDQVREFANQLLDDRDVDKIPAKAKAPAAELARKYGWEQGKFTPKEQTLLKESTTFLQDAMNDEDTLKALDEGYLSKQQMSAAIHGSNSESLTGNAIAGLAADNLSDKQVKFVQMYNQLIGTISGLGQLVRSGRTTEATITRLMKELPNPVTTRDSADAKVRLHRLMKEVTVAMEKGKFDESSAGRPSVIPAPGSKPTGGPIVVTTDDLKKAGVK